MNEIKTAIVKQTATVDSLVNNLEQKKDLANIFIKSGLIPAQLNTSEKVLVALFKSQELGLPPLEGISGMAVINGKVTLQGNLMLALISKSGKAKAINIDENETQCSVRMARNDYELDYTFKFTMEDARKAGLLGKTSWRQYQRTMLKWRAVSGCARVVFSDIIGGLYTPEEIASIDDAVEIKIDENEDVIIKQTETKSTSKNKENIEEAKVKKEKPAAEKRIHTQKVIETKLQKITSIEDMTILWSECTLKQQENEKVKAWFSMRKAQLQDAAKSQTEYETGLFPDVVKVIKHINSIEDKKHLENWYKKHLPDIQKLAARDYKLVTDVLENRNNKLKEQEK